MSCKNAIWFENLYSEILTHLIESIKEATVDLDLAYVSKNKRRIPVMKNKQIHDILIFKFSNPKA